MSNDHRNSTSLFQDVLFSDNKMQEVSMVSLNFAPGGVIMKYGVDKKGGTRSTIHRWGISCLNVSPVRSSTCQISNHRVYPVGGSRHVSQRGAASGTVVSTRSTEASPSSSGSPAIRTRHSWMLASSMRSKSERDMDRQQ